MNVRLLPRVLALALGGLWSGVGVRAAAEEPPPFSWADSLDPAVYDIVRVGNRSIEQYARALIGEVKRTLGETSPGLAVSKLHLRDYPLPAAKPGEPVTTAIRRTSLNLRSSANAPDAADRDALEFIQHRLEDGDGLPKVMLQKVAAPGQPVEWRLYQPLGITAQCVVCHGARDALDSDVKAALQIHYPDDKAVDYAPGAWRGVIRVSITAAPPAAAAPPRK